MLCNCPPKEDLLAFHLGTLPESAVDVLGDHLEECADCEATLERFEASDDPFLAALQPRDHQPSVFLELGTESGAGPHVSGELAVSARLRNP